MCLPGSVEIRLKVRLSCFEFFIFGIDFPQSVSKKINEETYSAF